jgi:phytoene desaturase
LIYFGTKKTYPNLAHHNVIFGPRYKGLLDDIFSKGVLADDFSLYLHAPTRSDPSLAPEGCEAFYVLSPVPHLGKADLDWKTVGPKYADRILDYLGERYIPGLRENLVTQRIFTPEDFKSELNSHLGAAFSLEPVLWQSAYFRTANRDPKLAGMYIVGAGTHPGAGLPGVVNSAKATVRVLLEDVREGRFGEAFRLPERADQIREPELKGVSPSAGL